MASQTAVTPLTRSDRAVTVTAPAGAAVGRRNLRVGIGLMLASSASNQAGAAVGALAFGGIGTFGVVAIRQIVSAVVLNLVARPSWRTFDRRTWLLVAALAADIGTMNFALYAAVDRLGLGLAVTLEFLGPLGVAVALSRRLVDVIGAVAAAAGVVILVSPGPTSDLIGILLGLLAAAMWAAYILLNRALGTRVSGLQAASAANAVSAAAWGIPAVIMIVTSRPPVGAVGLAVVCGLLSSAVPYAADLVTLRLVPASRFGTFMSVNPVWAFLAGWVLLRQGLAVHEVIGTGLVIAANVVATTAARSKERTSGASVPAGPSWTDRCSKAGAR